MILFGTSPNWEVRKWIPRKWDGKVPKQEEYRPEGDFYIGQSIIVIFKDVFASLPLSLTIMYKFSGWALYN